jgi:hypothetical protein
MANSKHGHKPDTQREALKRSEKKAAKAQPNNFKDEEPADKAVEVGPELNHAPIRGIDPERRSPGLGGSASAGEEDPGAALDDPSVRNAMPADQHRARGRPTLSTVSGKGDLHE